MIELSSRRLYLCVGIRDDMTSFLPQVIAGGVDVVQLREKFLDLTSQAKMAREMKKICAEFGVPFIVNDSPELALDVGSDGVHVGQDDVTVDYCRDLLGDEAIIGLSTHSENELALSLPQRATYFSAGPIEATPTKPGRVGTGHHYPVLATQRSDRPVFVTGGVNADNVSELVRLGLRHFVVVRALTESSTPGESARALRRALDAALSTVAI